ncbi:MAG TPA: helix-turn-helix domain-containing protein [Roseiflexaceae bacterium]|nr:helix-turn-helix domain-containing protein [Roseiflexaceae bacterium]
MDDVLFKDWLRRQRVALDLTQEALAEQVGCAVQTIRAFEHGWRRPSRPMAERLATILAVPPAQREAFLQAARATRPTSVAMPEPPIGPADPVAYLTSLASAMRERLYGPDQQQCLAQLDAELETIRAALAWALDADHPELARVELGLRAASAIERFWHGRGHQAEGQRWLEQGINLVERARLEADPAVLAAALSSAGWLARIRGDMARAMALLHRCVALYRAIGDAQGTSDALDTLGDMAIFEGDAIAATWFYEESLALRRSLGDPRMIALAINGLGHAAIVRGYYERAAEYFLESLAMLRDLHDRRSMALALHGLGLARLRQGILEEAASYLGEALSLFDALDNTLDVAICLELVGELLALRVLMGGGDAGALHEATQLWGASERMMETSSIRLSQSEQARRDALLAAVRLRLGSGNFQTQWDAGRALAQSEPVAAGLAAVQRLGSSH